MIRRKVYLEKDEKLFSVTEVEQREFGKGDNKGRAKRKAAKEDRKKTKARVQANGGTQAQAEQVIAQTGPKASKAGEIAKPVQNPGSTPKHVDPKPSGKIQKQLEAAKPKNNLPTVIEKQKNKVTEEVSKNKGKILEQGKGFFNKALNAVKTNKKVQAGLAATAITGAAVGTGMAVRKHNKKDDNTTK